MRNWEQGEQSLNEILGVLKSVREMRKGSAVPMATATAMTDIQEPGGGYAATTTTNLTDQAENILAILESCHGRDFTEGFREAESHLQEMERRQDAWGNRSDRMSEFESFVSALRELFVDERVPNESQVGSLVSEMAAIRASLQELLREASAAGDDVVQKETNGPNPVSEQEASPASVIQSTIVGLKNWHQRQKERTSQKASTTEVQSDHVATLLDDLSASRLRVLRSSISDDERTVTSSNARDHDPSSSSVSRKAIEDSLLKLLELCEEERTHLETASRIASDEFPRTDVFVALRACLHSVAEQQAAIPEIVKKMDASRLLQKVETVAPVLRRLPPLRNEILRANRDLARRKRQWETSRLAPKHVREELAFADDEDEKADLQAELNNAERDAKIARQAYGQAQLHLTGLQTQMMQVVQFGIHDVVGDDVRLQKIMDDFLDPDVPVLSIGFDSFVGQPKLLSSSGNARHALFLARMEQSTSTTTASSSSSPPVREVVIKRFSLDSPKDKDRVRHEIRLLNRMQPHDNIVRVDGVFFEQENSGLNAFVVMPFFRDGDLLQWKDRMDRCHLPICGAV